MLCQFFAKGPIDSYQGVMMADTKAYAVYFKEMLAQGIMLPPANMNVCFIDRTYTRRC